MLSLFGRFFFIGTNAERTAFVPLRAGIHFFATDAVKGFYVWDGTQWFFIGPSSGGPGGDVYWGSILGTLSNQTDLQNALNGKAASNHTHAESDVTNLVNDLAGKAPTSHTHTEVQVTNLVSDLAGKEPANANIQAHVTSAHAPANAQKNSDILKSEIEAKLTGEISTHTHAGGGAPIGYAINVLALTSSPVDSQTIYFGMLPKAPVTTANISKCHVRKAGTIKIANIYCYSGTAGSAEAWSLYIRKNNTSDTLIQTLSVSANERIFTNSGLAIAMAAGDYFEIKAINPLWATNPLTTIFGGIIYIE